MRYGGTLFIVLCLVIALLLGFLGGTIVARWCDLAQTFFVLTIGDLIKALVTIIMGSIVVYYLNIINTRSARAIDLVQSMLKDVDEQLDLIYSEGRSYMNGPSETSGHEILAALKSLSVKISLFEELRGKNSALFSEKSFQGMKGKSLEFKESLTGGNFAGNSNTYSEQQKGLFENSYTLTKKAITQYRIFLLS
jgi:hypothetical protein